MLRSMVLVCGLAIGVGACLSKPNPMSGDNRDSGVIDATMSDSALVADGAPDCTDYDSDGYLPANCGQPDQTIVDCVEDNPDVYPGAYDDPSDGLDQDCLDGPLAAGEALVPSVTTVPLGSITVTNEFLSVTFDPQQNFAMTELLSLRSANSANNLMYTGGAINERLSGVNEWNLLHSWRLGDGTVPDPTVLSRGRAVERFQVGWTASNPKGVSGGMTGVTRYTVHPDGRIHLDHDVTVSTGGGSNLTTYVVLSRNEFSNADWSNNAGMPYAITGVQDTSFYNGSAPMAQWTCSYGPTNGAVVGWSYNIPASQVSNGPRMSETFMNEPALSMVFDWVQGGPVVADDYIGNFLVTVDRRPDAGEACASVATQALPFLDPPTLTVDAPGAIGVDAGDDNSDGYNEGGGFYSVSAGDSQLLTMTINGATAAIPQTSTYMITDMAFNLRAPIVRLDGTRLSHGRDYLFHLDAMGRGWLYLGVLAGDGVMLTVAAR